RLGVARREVAGHGFAEARIAPFAVVVAARVGDLFRRTRVVLPLRHTHPAVVPQALAHQRQLGLMGAGYGNASRVNLGVARVGEIRTALVRAPRRRDVRVHRIGRQVIGRAVTAGAEQDRVADVAFDGAGQQVAHDDAPRL